MNHPRMWALAPLGPNQHHPHRDYMKILTDSHQLDIFSHRQDIVKNATVYSLARIYNIHATMRFSVPQSSHTSQQLLHHEILCTEKNIMFSYSITVKLGDQSLMVHSHRVKSLLEIMIVTSKSCPSSIIFIQSSIVLIRFV